MKRQLTQRRVEAHAHEAGIVALERRLKNLSYIHAVRHADDGDVAPHALVEHD
ncbi:MAG TPA: hypothetical protein VKX16_10355 [Chloroflexota bacterium]|nr:hypothetical protein [Chloroflexota bacterium]